MTRQIPETLRLVALTDTAQFSDCIEQARALCAMARPGTVAIVLRDRQLSTLERCAMGRMLRTATHETRQLLVVSDRVDLALWPDADGVALPTDGLSPSVVRRQFEGPILRAGHDLEKLTSADWEALSGVLVSPVAESRKDRPALGEAGLRQEIEWIASQAARVRVFALGGITAKSAASALAVGAAGVAAISAVWKPDQRGPLLAALDVQRAG